MKPRSIHINTDADLDRMLEAYYAGETTSDEEIAIAAYLKQLESVPEKYAADAALFKAMAAGRKAADTVHVPADLGRRIAEATYARPRVSRYLYFVRWASMAAVITVLAVVAVKIQRQEQPSEQPVKYVASELRRDSIVSGAGLPIADVSQDTIDVIVETTSAPARAVSTAASAVAVDDNPYVEVTDSATVTRIMGEVFGKLDNTLAIAEKSIKKTDLALNNIPETINKVLDK